MVNPNAQEILNRILEGLKSGDGGLQLSAMRELHTLNFSSEAVVIQLEKLALGADEGIRQAALDALRLVSSQFIARNLSTRPGKDREMILHEIDEWQADGLIEEHRAEILRRHYDFDLRPGLPVQEPAGPPVEANPTLPLESAEVHEPRPPVPARPAAPRPSLTQVLLSETSIRIYLYLGAFFVIASAAILAALVEAARLPILLIATAAFAAGAVGFKKRLPQPSFAFSIVFSFLLPIDGGVIAELLKLSGHGSDAYWGGVYLVMAVLWAFGTRFYESRAFSMAALAALILGLLNFSEVFDAPTHWNILVAAVGNLTGLAGVHFLKTWKDRKFAAPLFFTAQLLQVILFLTALGGLGIDFFSSEIPANGWIAHTLIWLCFASFYAASGILVPFPLFPWMSAASLFLFPWLFLSIFDASAPVQVAGFGAWAASMAFAGEWARRSKNAALPKYHHPLIGLSLPLFFVSILWGFVEGVEYAFAALLGTGIAYTIVHALRPRWYVWMAALLAGLGAYFTFFALPFMQKTEVVPAYRLLSASVLLLLPELFFKGPLTFARPWNWVPVALGTLVTGFGILYVHGDLLASGKEALGEAAIMLGVYTALFAAYALRLRRPWVGYLAGTSAALTVVYALDHFDLDLWLPALTALSTIYYFGGFLLAREEETKRWASMLIRSGLALGMLISAAAAIALEPGGGWYALAIAALFVIEMFTRRAATLELMVESLLTFALILLLRDFKVHELTWYFFGVGLAWLACDAVFKLTFAGRKWNAVTKAVGALIALLSVFTITIDPGLDSAPAAACFAVYTVFFAAYALVYKSHELGYLSTAGAAATLFYALDYFDVSTWLPVFTGLSSVYYFVGFLLRRKTQGWSETFRYSGLGLGGLMSLITLFQLKETGGGYAAIIGLLFVVETLASRNGWFEAGVHPLFSIALVLILRDLDLDRNSHLLLALSLAWLGGDLFFEKRLEARKVSLPVRTIGGIIAAANALLLLSGPPIEAAICFGVYAAFFAGYAWLYKKPLLAYLSTAALPLAVYFAFRAGQIDGWLFALTAVAVSYYGAGYPLRRAGFATEWRRVLLFSGLGLGTILGLSAPFQAGHTEKAIAIAVAATLFAVEAFALKNVRLAFPANALYLAAYFTLLVELDVNEPQYFSVGAALLGMVMHFLLTRAGSKTGAFLMGLASQLVLLGTTYIQMAALLQLSFFFVLFVQSLVILVYGIVMRSRSLVLAPIGFSVLGVVTVIYYALKDLSLVVIIGITGIVLLSLGILAVLMRERIATFAERFSDWNA